MSRLRYRKRKIDEAAGREKVKEALAKKVGRKTSEEEIREIRKKGFYRKIR